MMECVKDKCRHYRGESDGFIEYCSLDCSACDDCNIDRIIDLMQKDRLLIDNNQRKE